MNLTNVSEMKDFFSNRKAKLIKRYIFVGLLSSITLFASIKAISITNKFIHLHGNDPLTSTNVWYIPLALFSPILAIISVGIFIQAILKLKNYRKNIFTRNDFKININEKNNCLTNIGNYININSVVNLLLSINLIDDLIYLSINKIEQIESLLLYNQTLLKECSLNEMPKELKRKIIGNTYTINYNLSFTLKEIQQQKLMDNAEFINLLANENMTQKIKQVRQKEYDLMVLTNQQKDQEEKAKKESKKQNQSDIEQQAIANLPTSIFESFNKINKKETEKNKKHLSL